VRKSVVLPALPALPLLPRSDKRKPVVAPPAERPQTVESQSEKSTATDPTSAELEGAARNEPSLDDGEDLDASFPASTPQEPVSEPLQECL
jgi:hypothetical protein